MSSWPNMLFCVHIIAPFWIYPVKGVELIGAAPLSVIWSPIGLEPKLQYLDPIVALLSCVLMIYSPVSSSLLLVLLGVFLVLDLAGQIPQHDLTVGAQYLSMSYEKNVSRRILHP